MSKSDFVHFCFVLILFMYVVIKISVTFRSSLPVTYDSLTFFVYSSRDTQRVESQNVRRHVLPLGFTLGHHRDATLLT